MSSMRRQEDAMKLYDFDEFDQFWLKCDQSLSILINFCQNLINFGQNLSIFEFLTFFYMTNISDIFYIASSYKFMILIF